MSLTSPTETGNQKSTKILEGCVVSDKMNKTVTVLVERKIKHPTLGKTLIKSKKYHADVNDFKLSIGDIIRIAECAPISKTKSWRVFELIKSAE
jgi:small subunit ribosomal protein S17